MTKWQHYQPSLGRGERGMLLVPPAPTPPPVRLLCG